VRTRAYSSHGLCLTRWRFLDTGYADPWYNMAADEAIATITGQEEWPPTVRVYGWRPAAISIGYSQRARKTVNVEKCVQLGIPLVRRLTGGRAVFHDEEVTYSVIARKGHLGSGDSVLETYRRIGQALVSSLERLGIRAHLRRMASGGIGQVAAHGLPPCFSSTGRYEVMVGGRKVVGSAQRWIGGVVLQHGSLLTGEGHLQIAHFLPHGDGVDTKNIVQELRKKTTSLGALLSRRVSYAEVVSVLFCGFQEAYQVLLEPGQLRPEERSLARRLVQERYGRQEWTLRK